MEDEYRPLPEPTGQLVNDPDFLAYWREWIGNVCHSHLPDSLEEPLLPPLEAWDYQYAAQNPNTWQYYTDPNRDLTAEADPDPNAIFAGREIGPDGKFTGNYFLNSDYQPVPATTDAEFSTEFELVFWRTIMGFNTVEHFITALSSAELIMILPPEDPLGQQAKYPLDLIDGSRQIYRVYTSAQFLPEDANPWLRRLVTGRELLEELCAIPNSWITFRPFEANALPGAILHMWWQEWQAAQAPPGPSPEPTPPPRLHW